MELVVQLQHVHQLVQMAECVQVLVLVVVLVVGLVLAAPFRLVQVDVIMVDGVQVLIHVHVQDGGLVQPVQHVIALRLV